LKSLPLSLLEVNVTEANTWDFPWFSETVPATEFSTKPVTVLVMTVGFSEDSIDGIDGSAAVEIAGGFEDILAVGEIEAGKFDENTDVKAEGIGILVGLSCWLSDLVNELGIDVVGLVEAGPRVVLISGIGVVSGKSLHGPKCAKNPKQ
jgi:hypothetical protein